MDQFLRHGEVKADTNLTENAIRPTAVGKRNWLFVGGEETGEHSAVIYSLIESARRHGHEPGAYLKEVLPLNWKPAGQAEAPLQIAG